MIKRRLARLILSRKKLIMRLSRLHSMRIAITSRFDLDTRLYFSSLGTKSRDDRVQALDEASRSE